MAMADRLLLDAISALKPCGGLILFIAAKRNIEDKSFE